VYGTTALERHDDVTRSASAGRRAAGSGRSKQGRWIALALQILGAVLVVSSLFVALFASHAGAALSNGSVTIKIASSGSVATSPIADGQIVDVEVAPNSTFNSSSLSAAGFPSGAVPIKVLECADLDGLAANLPKSPTDCEPATIRAVSGSAVDEDGSMLVTGYTIFALPDSADLGDSNGTVCDNTEHQCVLGIFSNQNSFTKPHLFSAPFQVTPSGLPNGALPAGALGSTNSSSASSSASATNGASAAVSVPAATLADTGGPTVWPWLLGVGCVLLVVGSTLRYLRRPARIARR
jgi:hypothetical protein